MDRTFRITANCVDLVAGKITPATVHVVDGVIEYIEPIATAQGFLLPGFIDAHIHIESSMLLPSAFARQAVVHGTVATVSDPHEIANVCGVAGIELMLRDAARSPMKFYFGAPSCVPATPFETAGAELDATAVEQLLQDARINHLAEMMNYPGVIAGDPEVMAKIQAAQARHLPIDGHAPGLRGEEAKRYLSVGISTDHECVSLDEALEKIASGCKIAIREGSAARNFEALWPLIDRFPESCFFCSDDKHPDELLGGHINQLVQRAIAMGCDKLNVLRVACLNPVVHYGLDVGRLQLGDPADFVLVNSLDDLQIQATYIDGTQVARNGKATVATVQTATVPVRGPDSDAAPAALNNFHAETIEAQSLEVSAVSPRIRVIVVEDGQLITKQAIEGARTSDGLAVSNPENDCLKLVVLNRYGKAKPAVAFVRGFGLKSGAIASTVAHDSHNIVAVGVEDADICDAMNTVIQQRGGLSVASGGVTKVIPLPVAGLMSLNSCENVAANYIHLNDWAKDLGSILAAPFMSLSFLPLLVIPSLKLSDKGLFDVERFEFVPLFVELDV